MRRALGRILIALGVGGAASACGRACTNDTSDAPGSSASSASSAPSGSSAPSDARVHAWDIPDGKVPFQKPKVPIPEELRGVWHLPSPRGAIDLELHDDEMIVWRLSDCVCVGGGCARWESAHGTTEVRADYGWRLYWPTGVYERGVPQSAEVRRVHLSVRGDKMTATFEPMPRADGDAGASGEDAGLAPQTWEKGGVCPKCRPAVPGPLPDGPPVACVPDFMFCPLSNSSSFACH